MAPREAGGARCGENKVVVYGEFVYTLKDGETLQESSQVPLIRGEIDRKGSRAASCTTGK